jgi:hypothetical protein
MDIGGYGSRIALRLSGTTGSLLLEFAIQFSTSPETRSIKTVVASDEAPAE